MANRSFSKFVNKILLLSFFLTTTAFVSRARAIYDFDGDGRTDFIVRRAEAADSPFNWYIFQSRDGFVARTWGYRFAPGAGITDTDAFGDYDGDGRWDIAVARSGPAMPSMIWYVLDSATGSFTARHWGISTDIPVPQDYDGDGKTDLAVYRSGWWYISRSTDGQLQAVNFGAGTDEPFTGGDYDGDGKDDIAVIRDTNTGLRYLYILCSGSASWAEYYFGVAAGNGVASGDYDGDGRADVAIWTFDGDWYWIRSSDGLLGSGGRFGTFATDMGAPGDYDGDGKTDLAVFRRSSTVIPGTQFYFYVQQSRDGLMAMPWGRAPDTYPVSRRLRKANGFPFPPGKLLPVRKSERQ